MDNIWDGIEMKMREEWGLIKLDMKIKLKDLPFFHFFQSVLRTQHRILEVG